MINRSHLFGKSKYPKFKVIPAILLCFGLISGCVHAPGAYRPSHWMTTPTTIKSIADSPDQPRLQVIIVYGPAWCHHTALRLICPDRPVLFWDPGGAYGVSKPEEVRSKDIIKVDPPDLETYLEFTWKHSSVEVEVFEWDLPIEHARELYDVLMNGTGKDHPAGGFKTSTMGMFCSTAVSGFLNRFAKKTMTVPQSFFLPHKLAQALYTQSPKRVMVFRRNNLKVIDFPR